MTLAKECERMYITVKHRKISFGDFQTETIGISVKKILIEVLLIQQIQRKASPNE